MRKGKLKRSRKENCLEKGKERLVKNIIITFT
jgi:hypothetical protein